MDTTSSPPLLKAKRITGKSLVLRNATTSDAAFILSLRTDNRKSQHLSNTSPNLNKQVAWLEDYAARTNQAYFIIESKTGESLGTVRLYDPQGDSFCWGSWILKDGAPQSAAIESALIVYAYAIDHLGFSQAHFDVRKGNESVWHFHERFGAVCVAETDQDYLYQIGQKEINAARQRYKKYLPEPVVLESENEH
jgi:RimJ/RimL family protein N-acetyltransferase